MVFSSLRGICSHSLLRYAGSLFIVVWHSCLHSSNLKNWGKSFPKVGIHPVGFFAILPEMLGLAIVRTWMLFFFYSVVIFPWVIGLDYLIPLVLG